MRVCIACLWQWTRLIGLMFAPANWRASTIFTRTCRSTTVSQGSICPKSSGVLPLPLPPFSLPLLSPPTSQTKIFSHQCAWGHLQPVGGGVKHPLPSTNQTLQSAVVHSLVCRTNDWLIDRVKVLRLTRHKKMSFRRRSSQPISWPSTENKRTNPRHQWRALTTFTCSVICCIRSPSPQGQVTPKEKLVNQKITKWNSTWTVWLLYRRIYRVKWRHGNLWSPCCRTWCRTVWG